MLRIIRRHTTAPMAVALVALFAALGGVALASPVAQLAATITGSNVKNGSLSGADLKDSSVTTSDIKDGSLNSADIGSRTIDSSDIKDESLTGQDINESTLQHVGSADVADKAGDATTLGGKSASDFEPVRGDKPFAFTISGAGDRTIVTGGGVRIFARCEANDAGTPDVASFYISTSTDDVSFDDNNGPEEDDFDAADGEALLFSEDSDDSANIEVTGSGSGLTAVAADGTVVSLNDYSAAVDLGGHNNTCTFTGVATSIKQS